MVTTFLLHTKGELEGAVFLDTGVATFDTLPHVKKVCQRFGWPLEIYRTPYDYDQLVLKYGFPGRKKSHAWFVSYLKGRGVRQFKKAHPDGLLASGVRKKESKRRLRQAQEWGEWEQVKVYAPILDWSTEQVWAYIRDNNLPVSPAYQALHISGDCLCGAFADPNELGLIQAFYPDEYSRITSLQEKRKAISTKDCSWGGTSQCPQGQCGL